MAQAVKTYQDWKGSLDEYLMIGDLVDDEMVDYFLNALPPACWNGRVIQLGEPYSHVGHEATFSTLVSTSDGWTYAGHCFRGQTQPVPEMEA